MRNRRPNLKRDPTLADFVAECVRQEADKLGMVVRVYVRLYKRAQDFVSVQAPKRRVALLRENVAKRLMDTGLSKSVTFLPYLPSFEVWCCIEALVPKVV